MDSAGSDRCQAVVPEPEGGTGAAVVHPFDSRYERVNVGARDQHDCGIRGLEVRPDFLKPYSGLARGQEEVLAADGSPLVLVSQPILKMHPGEAPLNLEPWQAPVSGRKEAPAPWKAFAPARSFPNAETLANIVKSEKAFVLGGTQLIVEFGLKPSWYRDDDCRKDALALIEKRGWRPLLTSLAGKENDVNDLFGKAEIVGWLQTLPPPKRRGVDQAEFNLTSTEVRKRHPLRLRKIIEVMVLTEAIITRRFLEDKSRDRFAAVSGLPEAEANAAYVYDHFWIEPLLYVLWPEPRHADIPFLIENDEVATAFEQTTGQDRWVLHGLLLGAPGKLRTIEAAAAACNKFYRTAGGKGDPSATFAVSALKDRFSKRAKHVEAQRKGGASFKPSAEDPRELGLIGGKPIELSQSDAKSV